MSSNAATNRELAEWLVNAFKEVDWPIPPYLQLGGFLSPLAKAVKDARRMRRLRSCAKGLRAPTRRSTLRPGSLTATAKSSMRGISRRIDQSPISTAYTFNAAEPVSHHRGTFCLGALHLLLSHDDSAIHSSRPFFPGNERFHSRTIAAKTGNKLAHQLWNPGRIAEWIVGIS